MGWNPEELTIVGYLGGELIKHTTAAYSLKDDYSKRACQMDNMRAVIDTMQYCLIGIGCSPQRSGYRRMQAHPYDSSEKQRSGLYGKSVSQSPDS